MISLTGYPSSQHLQGKFGLIVIFVIKLLYLKMRYSPYVSKQRLCLHFVIQNIEFYSTTIYIFMILEYNKLSRDNNQALQEHKMK
jgi:hypothetical protein